MTKAEINLRIKIELIMDGIEDVLDYFEKTELNDFYDKAKNDGRIEGAVAVRYLIEKSFPEMDWVQLMEDNPKSEKDIMAFLLATNRYEVFNAVDAEARLD